MQHVLIIGASGGIGSKLYDAMCQLPDYNVTGWSSNDLNLDHPDRIFSCNFSKFANINLYLDYFNINHSQNDMILKVFCVNYNILRIVSGMGGLAFSN